MKEKMNKVLSVILAILLGFGLSSILFATLNKLDDKPTVEEEAKEPIIFLDGYIVDTNLAEEEIVGYVKIPVGTKTNSFYGENDFVRIIPKGFVLEDFSVQNFSVPTGLFNAYVLKDGEEITDHNIVNFTVDVLSDGREILVFAENYYIPVGSEFVVTSAQVDSLSEVNWYLTPEWPSCVNTVNQHGSIIVESYHSQSHECSNYFFCLHSGPDSLLDVFVIYKAL